YLLYRLGRGLFCRGAPGIQAFFVAASSKHPAEPLSNRGTTLQSAAVAKSNQADESRLRRRPYDNPEHMVLQNKMDEPISGSPRKKGPLWILYSYGLHNIKELFQDLGMLPCEVLFFRNILAKVEEQKLRLWPQHMKFDRLPIPFPHRLFPLLLMKLPIQVFMF